MERSPIKKLVEKEGVAILIFLIFCIALALKFAPSVGSDSHAPAVGHAVAPWIFGPIQILLLYLPTWLGAIIYPVIVVTGLFGLPWLVDRFGIKFGHSVFMTLYGSALVLLMVFFLKEFWWK